MSTIKSNKEVDRLFKEGKRVSHPLVVTLISETPEKRDLYGRVAFVAGKKLGNAVFRNRCRRVLRETVRRLGGPWPGYDIVLISRRDTATASPESLDRALKRNLIKAGVVNDKSNN